MPLTPIQIKDKLLKGLDGENNVTNAVIVREVITTLEHIALNITKEDLETTRLGRYINDLRKKTSDKNLASRARKLIKLWQQIDNDTPRANNASPALSYTPGTSPRLSGAQLNNVSPAFSNRSIHSPALSQKHGVSPALSRASPALSHASPALNNIHKNSASPAASSKLTPPGVPGRKVTLANSHRSSPEVAKSSYFSVEQSAFSGNHHNLKRSSSPAVPVRSATTLAEQQNSTPYKRISPVGGTKSTQLSINHQSSASPGDSSVHSITPTVPGRSVSRPHTPTVQRSSLASGQNGSTNSSANSRDKKRRRSDDSLNSDASSAKKGRHLMNGESIPHRTLPPERIRTPKVKTTVQLIAELAAQKNSSLAAASDTITKIVTNQIQKEKDDVRHSIVPEGAKPRSRKKPVSNAVEPPDNSGDLSKTKSELVHRFLQHAVERQNSTLNQSHINEDGEVDIVALDSPQASNSLTKSAYGPTVDPYSLLPPLDYSEITWSSDDDNPTAIRRNPITGEYPDGYDNSRLECSDEDTDERRFSLPNWSGVDGTQSIDSQFHSWTDTFSVQRTSDPNDPMYVLPYVDID